MEQIHFATATMNTPLMPDTLLHPGASIGNGTGDRHGQPLFISNRVVFSGRHCIEFSREAQADTAIETTASDQSNQAHTVPLSTRIADYEHASNAQLISAARSSDEHAFLELTGRCAGLVRRTVFRILHNREDTEDTVQETLFKAYTHLNTFRGVCNFSTWLTRIAIYTALMVVRKRKTLRTVSFDQAGDDDQTWGNWEFPDEGPNAEQVYASKQTRELLLRAVRQLPRSIDVS